MSVLLLAIFMLLGGFLWGFASSQYQVFPFALVRAVIKQGQAALGKDEGPRFLPESYVFRDSNGRQALDCDFADPLVFLAIGQSNAANFLSSFSAAEPSVQAYQFFDGRCYPIEDPVLGATGDRGSLWPRFAQDLSERTGRPVVFITTAVGGSALELWLNKEGPYYQRTLKQIELARGAGLPVDFVLWLQGESDAQRGTPQQLYADGLESLIAGFGTSFGEGVAPQWVIFQASICRRGLQSSPDILAAQKAVADKLPRALLGPNGDRLGRRFRHDDCHFNADGRAEILAELEAVVLQALEP